MEKWNRAEIVLQDLTGKGFWCTVHVFPSKPEHNPRKVCYERLDRP